MQGSPAQIGRLMLMGDKFTLSITVLLTGFAVVFAVLLILIGLIKLYGTIVYSILSKRLEKKMNRNADLPKVERVPEPDATVDIADETVSDDDEILAVITAAVYSMYPSGVQIKSVRKVAQRGSAWRNAGLTDNIRPF